jgi:hypothetical protein
VKEKKDGRRNLFGKGICIGKSWQCFRRMCAFSLFKNKGILLVCLFVYSMLAAKMFVIQQEIIY